MSKEKKTKKAYIYYENNNNLNINDDYKSEISVESFYNEIIVGFLINIENILMIHIFFLLKIFLMWK